MDLFQELSGKDQEKVAEVSRVRVELQEQIGLLQAERTAQEGLKAKISALERELKGTCSPFLFIYALLPFLSKVRWALIVSLHGSIFSKKAK